MKFLPITKARYECLRSALISVDEKLIVANKETLAKGRVNAEFALGVSRYDTVASFKASICTLYNDATAIDTHIG